MTSCQVQNEMSLWEEKNPEIAQTYFKEQVPRNHPIMLELEHFDEKDLQRIDLLYRKSIQEDKNKPYINNLKLYGFDLMIKHGLKEDENVERKLFYIEEQLSVPHNLPNIGQFYRLMISLIGQVDDDVITQKISTFRDKNFSILENSNNFTTEFQRKKKIELYRTDLFFHRESWVKKRELSSK